MGCKSVCTESGVLCFNLFSVPPLLARVCICEVPICPWCWLALLLKGIMFMAGLRLMCLGYCLGACNTLFSILLRILRLSIQHLYSLSLEFLNYLFR